MQRPHGQAGGGAERLVEREHQESAVKQRQADQRDGGGGGEQAQFVRTDGGRLAVEKAVEPGLVAVR